MQTGRAWFLIIAHCNFGNLRGGESERDELFVWGIRKKYGVEVLVEQFDTTEYVAENKLSTHKLQEKQGINWFAQLAGSQESGVNTSSLLLTAHHADDNNETLLMNFFREPWEVVNRYSQETNTISAGHYWNFSSMS